MGPAPKWLCDAVGEVIPNSTHYIRHLSKGEPPCDRSRAEHAARNYQKKHGTLEGWEHRPTGQNRREPYDCGWRETGWVPNTAHANWHMDNGGLCDQGKKERAAAYHIRKYGSLEGWEYTPWRTHSCVPSDDVVPSYAHKGWHAKRGEDACQQSRVERSAYNWLRNYGTMRGWDGFGKGKVPFEGVRFHYRIWFGNGDRYDGITRKAVNERVAEHRRGGDLKGHMLRTMMWRVEDMGSSPDWDTALRRERELINEPNAGGRVLNKAGYGG